MKALFLAGGKGIRDSIITSNAFVLKHKNYLNTVYSRDINPLYQNREAT